MKLNNRLAVIPVVAVFVISTILLAKSPASSAGTNDVVDEQTIRQLNEQMLHAYDVADLSILDRVETDDFTVSGDFGIANKQQHLDRTRKRGPYSFEVNRKIENQQFRFYGAVALLTEVDRASTKGGGSSSYQSTSVWIRQGETWRVAHLHYSELAENQYHVRVRPQSLGLRASLLLFAICRAKRLHWPQSILSRFECGEHRVDSVELQHFARA